MVERDVLYAYQGLKDSTKGEESVEDHLPTSITQGASNLHSDEDMEDKIKLLDPRLQTLIRTYLEVCGELQPPASCDKLVQMDLKLKHEIRRRPYPVSKVQADEIERQIQECIDARLVLEYKDGDYPQHCSPCFLVAKPGSTAKRLLVDYGEQNKKTLNHSGSIRNMESTLEKIASCRYKTKMDKRSGFWKVYLTPNSTRKGTGRSQGTGGPESAPPPRSSWCGRSSWAASHRRSSPTCPAGPPTRPSSSRTPRWT